MKRDRPLAPTDRALWARVTASVQPLHRHRPAPDAAPETPAETAVPAEPPPPRVKGRVPLQRNVSPSAAVAAPAALTGGLDGQWNRQLHRGQVQPDIVIDLHGLTLAGAHARLDQALGGAAQAGVRIILLIVGRPRDHDRAGGGGRGAIRAAVEDWLGASRHAGQIAAVRPAHPRHGGAGALYLILRRAR